MNGKTYLKKQKRQNIYKLIAVTVLVIMGLQLTWFWQTAVGLLMIYLLHELFGSDHHFYNPNRNFDLPLAADIKTNATIHNNHLLIPEKKQAHTWLLKCQIKSTLLGYIWDPYITITAENKVYRQYVERKSNGTRYLNLSTFSDNFSTQKNTQLHIQSTFCRVKTTPATLYGFKHPDYSKQRIMVLAPHADDAELAAFGLYSQSNTYIATITAGETEIKQYKALTKQTASASRLKGRLRALDSLSAARWGNVPAQQHVNLGYFCKQLQHMAQHPDKPIASTLAKITDTRIFRQYNEIVLPSDSNGAPTWRNLMADLKHLINQWQPDVIITPHPQIDPHPDHYYTTLALQQVLNDASPPFPKELQKNKTLLLYANHYHYSQDHPCGPAFTGGSIPPLFKEDSLTATKIYCHPLSNNQQIDKYCAIELMHDLRRPLSLKKRLRRLLQHWFLNRPLSALGHDDYLRKAVRTHEVFYNIELSRLSSLFPAE